MNVGQILETHLGWAAHELGVQVAALAAEMTSAAEVRELFKARFAGTAALNQLLDLDDVQTLRVAAGMKRGIWFGTAVFDGAQEKEIKALLASAGLPARARLSSTTACSAKSSSSPATVGLHLHAQAVPPVDDKIHARSIGTVQLDHAAAARR